LISHPVVGSVLTGVTSPDQAAANAAAACWLLSENDKSEIDTIVEREGASS
jgi:aryl-alcohol dehydrogenase-like predicted oxidoreductase